MNIRSKVSREYFARKLFNRSETEIHMFFFLMALGTFITINVVNCTLTEMAEQYVEECRNEGVAELAIVHCVYKKAGIIDEKGNLHVEVLRALMLEHSNIKDPVKFHIFLDNLHRCIKEDGPSNSVSTAMVTLIRCLGI